MKKTLISLVVITLNEERNIARCLKSVSWADDIVVLDCGSQDQTLEIARRLGARVFQENWRGYRAQKERATELALHDWVLSLDADEALSPRLSRECEALIQSGRLEDFDGYRMPRLSFHMGRWIRHGGWFPDFQTRLFQRKRCRWAGGHVHEYVEGAKIQTLPFPLLHWVFQDLAHQVQTNNRYSSNGAEDLADRKKSFHLIPLILKPVSKFLETYIVKRGFLDGLPGFIISVGAAYSIFLKYAKLWEIRQRSEIERSRGELPPDVL